MKQDNTIEFPGNAEELQGIAEGAGVSLDAIWVSNLLVELENLMFRINNTRHEHCSDIFAVSRGGFENGFAHGHNEDWSDTIKKFWYFLAFTADDTSSHNGLDFAGCAGVTYPGTLVGWGPSWNRHGMYLTANVLVPRWQRRSGLASVFVQRRAFCPARTMDELIVGLTVPGWTGSVSNNLVDLRNKRMANFEVWENRHSVFEVTASMANYSHFNEFKHLKTADGQQIDVHNRLDTRQDRVDELPPPQSVTDIKNILSLHRGETGVIFQPHATIVTLVLNGTTGRLDVWCASPSAEGTPVYSWNLKSFFGPAEEDHGHHMSAV